MSEFRFRIEGDPPSWNHAYRDVIIKTKAGRSYRTRAKTQAATEYQTLATSRARDAMPEGWEPTEQLRIIYDFHFKRGRDADNALKMLNDSIAKGIGVNDSRFLPSVRSKTVGNKEPFVDVTIEPA